MNESKKFAFDVGITFFASIINMFLGFIITVLLGRYLGAGDLGLYRMASTIYGISMLIAAIGIPAAMIKFVAENKGDSNKTNEIVSSGIITSLIIGICFSAIFYLSSDLLESIFNFHGLSKLIKIMSPVFPFALVGGALLGLLNGLREIKKYSMAIIIQSFLMLVISIVLTLWGLGVKGIIIGMVLSSFGWFLYLVLVSKDYFKITFNMYFQTTKRIILFGAQLMIAGAFNEINNQMDILLIGFFLISNDVGYYAAAITLSRFFWFIPLSIQMITYPVTAEYWYKNKHIALSNMIEKTLKYCTIILLLIGLQIGFFAEEIITKLFTAKFIYAVFPLKILLVGTVIRGCLIQPIGGSLGGIGRPDLSLKISILMMSINVILDILLIPKIGIVGAAIAASISLVGGSLMNIYLIIKILFIKIEVKWYLMISAFALFAIILFALGEAYINIYLLDGSIIIIYIILVTKLFLTKEDKHIFREIVYPVIFNRR